MKVRLASLSFTLVILSCLSWGNSLAQVEREEYFKETGHRVSGEFYLLYISTPNYLQMFGYPITDAFLDTNTGNLIQYFQKARFELDPEAPEGRRVRLSPLGDFMYERGEGEPLPTQGGSSACPTFPETGFKICDTFLVFFEENGGLEMFGYPLSNAEMNSGRIVQYFQNARFEWHPEFPSGNRVILTDLGSQYFYVRRENPVRLLPDDNGDIIKGLMDLRASAYPGQAVTSLNGRQTVYVIVQDQRLLPVSDAEVSLVVHLPSGEIGRYMVPTPTNKDGVIQFEFEFNSSRIGEAEIEVIVMRDHLEAHTVTSYRVWW